MADHRQLAQPADGLDLAKALLDAFAYLLADAVPRVLATARGTAQAQTKNDWHTKWHTSRL